MFCTPGMVSAVPRAIGPVFIFCAPGLVFDGTEGVGPRFRVFLARIDFRWNRGRRILFSCFARPESFSAETRVSCTIFIFCGPEVISRCTEGVGYHFHVLRAGLAFGGIESVRSCFHVLPSRTTFRRYGWRRVSFSCFARPYMFSEVPSASGPIFMFCAPKLIFRRSRGDGSCFHVLLVVICFWRYRGRRVSFSCFALRDIFSTVPRASAPIFMFCTPGLVFGGNVGDGSRFHFLRSRSYFPPYRGRWVPFSCFARQTHFRRYRVRRLPFLCFARPDSFSTVPSCFALTDMFLAVPSA
jgi:hypothetical protein